MAADLAPLLSRLAALSPQLESGELDWPGPQFEELAKSGVLGYVIPREHGGGEVTAAELTASYVRLSTACLVTTFVLTQRNGACQRIAASENEELKAMLLPTLSRGERFATVGVSHLTTSRQHLGRPAVTVEQRGSVYRLNGTAPWVTGAKYADDIVTGGTCADGRQILAAVPTDAPGVAVNPPPKLLALNASQTGSVEFDGVEVDERRVIAGPVEQVMKQGVGGGAGSLTTSALAVGTALGTLQRLEAEMENRPSLADVYKPLADEQAKLESDLHVATSNQPGAPSVSTETLRSRANSLVLRVAQAYLTAAKGAGFLAGHPAERALREAAFFLVWSCPQPVQTAALREFACSFEA